MKILQVNCVYKKGSTGKIVYDIHTELLKRGIESVVCYGRGEKINEPNVYKTCGELYSDINHLWSNISGVAYGACAFSTKKLISVIKKEKPDIVHLHCINGYFVNIYRLVNWLKKNKLKTVLTLHAEFMYTGGCGHSFECEQWRSEKGCGKLHKCPRFRSDIGSYFFDRTPAMWRRMKNAFLGFETLAVTSVSPWLTERAKLSPILRDFKHYVVMNGLDTSVFHPYDTLDLKKEYGLVDEKIIFHATPSFSSSQNHIKGGYYIIELAKRLQSENFKFFVAGSFEENISVPDNVVLLGRVANQEQLAKLYSMADLTVIPSKRETFSMIAAESLCCGTPVVGFKAGGPESIAISEYCEFVDYGDTDALLRAVKERIGASVDAEVCMKKYSKKIMTDAYIDIYKQKTRGDYA